MRGYLNLQVARNTKALVAKVGSERMSLLPKVTSHILEAMDRVSHECKDTFAAIVNNNSNGSFNGKSRTTAATTTTTTTTTLANGCAEKLTDDEDKHRALFHKLEVLFKCSRWYFLPYKLARIRCSAIEALSRYN